MNLGGGITDPAARARVIASAFSGFQVGATPPHEMEEARHLQDALSRAEKAVSDWRESSSQADLLRAKFECSAFTIERNGEVCRLVKNLAALGLEMFSVRISALGLGANKTLELFRGSSDFRRFVFDEPTLQDLRLAWNDPSGPTHYLDSPVAAMVHLVTRWTAEIEYFGDLLVQGKKELAKASKVLAAAA